MRCPQSNQLSDIIYSFKFSTYEHEKLNDGIMKFDNMVDTASVTTKN